MTGQLENPYFKPCTLFTLFSFLKCVHIHVFLLIRNLKLILVVPKVLIFLREDLGQRWQFWSLNKKVPFRDQKGTTFSQKRDQKGIKKSKIFEKRDLLNGCQDFVTGNSFYMRDFIFWLIYILRCHSYYWQICFYETHILEKGDLNAKKGNKKAPIFR